VVDLLVRGLPQNADPIHLKQVAQVKHVISVSIDHDALTNACTGSGRVKLRLGPGEDLETVKLKYIKAGYGVEDYSENTKKKSAFT